MKSILNRICALALALLLVLPAFALAEAAPVDISSDAVESAAAEAKDVSLAAESNSTYVEDGDEVILSSSGKSVTCQAGISFTVDLDDGDATSWKSSNKKVCKVSDGTVECLKKGTAKITVKGRDDDDHKVTRTLKVTVKDDRRLVLSCEDEDGKEYTFKSGESVSCYAGFTTTMSAEIRDGGSDDDDEDVEWSSSSKKVVSIDKESGELVAHKTGTAKITATAKGGLKQTVTFKVKKNTYNTTHSKSEYARQALDEEAAILAIKSITIESATKVVVTFVLFNGTEEKISKLRNLSITIDGDDGDKSGDFLSGDFGTVSGSCKRHSTKEFKLTFKGDQVIDADWKLSSRHFEPEMEYDFDY